MCPGKSARLPIRSLSLGSLAQKAPPSRGVRNKSCLREALGHTDKPRDQRVAARPKKGNDPVGQEMGLGAGSRWAEDAQELGLQAGLSGGAAGTEENLQGRPKEGRGHPARPQGGLRTREETRKRRGQEERVSAQFSKRLSCVH